MNSSEKRAWTGRLGCICQQEVRERRSGSFRCEEPSKMRFVAGILGVKVVVVVALLFEEGVRRKWGKRSVGGRRGDAQVIRKAACIERSGE